MNGKRIVLAVAAATLPLAMAAVPASAHDGDGDRGDRGDRGRDRDNARVSVRAIDGEGRARVTFQCDSRRDGRLRVTFDGDRVLDRRVDCDGDRERLTVRLDDEDESGLVRVVLRVRGDRASDSDYYSADRRGRDRDRDRR